MAQQLFGEDSKDGLNWRSITDCSDLVRFLFPRRSQHKTSPEQPSDPGDSSRNSHWFLSPPGAMTFLDQQSEMDTDQRISMIPGREQSVPG